MKMRIVYAVKCGAAVLVDTCAGGTWRVTQLADAVTWTSLADLLAELEAADVVPCGVRGPSMTIVPIVEVTA